MPVESSQEKKILLVYIEPTPYILGLIKNIILIFIGQIDIVFLKENASQNWNLELDNKYLVLPDNKLKRILTITRLILKNKYNVVHIAGWSEPTFLFAMFLSKIRSIPVSVESDTPIPHETKRCKKIIKRIVYPPVFSLINIFLPGGTRQAKYIEYFGVDTKRIIPVQMTVDVDAIRKYVQALYSHDRTRIRKLYNIEEEDIVYLFVGRLETHKGILNLIAVFEEIKDKNLKLLIVGDGSLRCSIETVVKTRDNIRYAGRLSENSLIDTYYAADVLVLPSHFEPWGLVVNEAMAVGKPVIVSDRVGCIDDLITDENGAIIKSDDIDDLRSTIIWLSGLPDLREKMGNKARQIIANWTLENEAENICNAWKQIISV